MASEKLPAKIAFTYNSVAFAFDDRRFINLTEMWKAAGSDEKKKPSNWRRYDGAGFIADLAKTLNVREAHIIKGERGKGGSTWAHWQITLAYAKYLSHEFHRYVNEAFRDWSEEKADPGLKMDRAVDGYVKQGKEIEWINRRFKGITARKAMCATMKEHNCKVIGKENPYVDITRAMSLRILGHTPGEFKESKGLDSDAKTRDFFDEDQLISFEWAEIQARKLMKAKACVGNTECIDAGVKAAEAVKAALDSLSAKTG